MTSKLTGLIFTLIFVGTDTIGQKVYEGIIKNKSTGESIAYVNIGILNKDIGTVADNQGKFRISIAEQNHHDSIRLSIVGYKSRQFKVADFVSMISKDKEIEMEEMATTLSEVVISSKRLNQKKLVTRQNRKISGEDLQTAN